MNNLAIVDWKSLPSRRQISAKLDRLNIPADGKVALAQLADMTTIVGGAVIEVGRRVVAFALELFRQFPNLAFCAIVALIVSALIGGVPLLGPSLQALLGPLLLAAGITLGALHEMRDGDLRGRIDLLTREFQAIFA